MAITDPDKRRWWADNAPQEVVDATVGRLLFSQSTGVARNGTNVGEQSLFGTAGTSGSRDLQLSAGDMLRLGILGRVSRDTGSPTFRFRLYLGTKLLADSGSQPPAYTSGTNGSMFGIVDISVIADGVAGSVRPNGFIDLGSGLGTAIRHALISLSPVAVSLDTPQTLNVTVQIQSGGAGVIAEATSLTLGNIRV
jgi:hypothetical protein